MTALNALLPLFFIILLGAILRRRGFIGEGVATQLNRLLFWVGLPALLFYKAAEPVGDWQPVWRLLVVLSVGLVGCIVAAAAWCALVRAPRRQWAAAVQGAFRGNLAFVGLPVLLRVLPPDALAGGMPTETLAVLLLGVAVPLYNVVGITVLLAGQVHDGGTRPVGRHLLRIVWHAGTNPLVLACLAGFAWAAFVRQPLPLLVHDTCATLGEMTVPLSLLCVGAFLRLNVLRGHLALALAVTTIKVALAPLLGYLCARWLQLPAEMTRVALIYLACPTAVASFIMAEQMQADAELSAAIIVLTVLGAIPALTLVLLLTT